MLLPTRKEFISDESTPPYAILFHTWGEGEVSFQDWQTKPIPDLKLQEGFQKIEYCCKQAAQDGFQ
jgi:hypothetical protein